MREINPNLATLDSKVKDLAQASMSFLRKIFGSRDVSEKKQSVSRPLPRDIPLEPDPPLTEDQRKELERKQRLRREEPIRIQLANLMGASRGSARGISRMAHRAEKLIAFAESEFEERAFAPFWDAVEEAALNLAKCEHQSRILSKNIRDVSSEAVKLAKMGGDVPSISYTDELTTVDFVALAKQLRRVVRSAQTDFEFSSIYEQRRTNRILVEGFSTLGHTIQELGHKLNQSISRLNSDVSQAIAEVSEAQRKSGGEINEALQTESINRRRHEAKVEEMLDNIQENRGP